MPTHEDKILQNKYPQDAILRDIGDDFIYRLYPNLIQGTGSCTVALQKDETGFLDFITIEGKLIASHQLSEGSNQIPFGAGISPDLYLYKLNVSGELKLTGKIIKTE